MVKVNYIAPAMLLSGTNAPQGKRKTLIWHRTGQNAAWPINYAKTYYVTIVVHDGSCGLVLPSWQPWYNVY
jgi:hypothetical protein